MGYAIKNGADSSTSSYTIGAFHFPGWSTPGGGPVPSAPWSVIPANRLPLVGAYNEALQSHCDYELQLARDHGLAFFAYDWYTDIVSGAHVPFLEHAITNHKKSTVNPKPKFCINFVTQYNTTHINLTTFQTLVQYWITNYFTDRHYQTYGGKPLVFIFDIATFESDLGSAANVTSALAAARAAAVTAGLAGIHFVGLNADSSSYWKSRAATHGWDGISSYTVFFKTINGGDATATSKTGFDRLDDALFGGDEVISASTYHSWWGGSGYATPATLTDTGSAWVAPTLPAVNGWGSTAFNNFIIPIASGYDQRPWTYASSLAGLPTEAQFEAHLIKARNLIDSYRSKTGGFGVITAWNEYGEGQFLIPTVSTGYSRLKSIKKVFGST